MRRFWFLLLVVLSLAACSSAPPVQTHAGARPSAGDDALRTRPPGLPNFVDHSIGREEISIEAMGLVGVPYRWAGNTPASGFDCSGLVQYVLARAADVKLPRTTSDISRRGEAIEPDEIAPGDLVFFNTTGRPHSHVGIYVGKLRFVNAPSTGGTVRLDYLTNPYWAKRFDGIRRVAPPVARPAPFPAPFDTPTYLASPRPTPEDAPARSVNAKAAPPVLPNPVAAENVPEDASRPLAAPGPAAPAANADAGAADTVDAFEPPPSAAALAARQAHQAGARAVQGETVPLETGVSHASIGAPAQPAITSTTDDPIARFADGAQ